MSKLSGYPKNVDPHYFPDDHWLIHEDTGGDRKVFVVRVEEGWTVVYIMVTEDNIEVQETWLTNTATEALGIAKQIAKLPPSNFHNTTAL